MLVLKSDQIFSHVISSWYITRQVARTLPLRWFWCLISRQGSRGQHLVGVREWSPQARIRFLVIDRGESSVLWEANKLCRLPLPWKANQQNRLLLSREANKMSRLLTPQKCWRISRLLLAREANHQNMLLQSLEANEQASALQQLEAIKSQLAPVVGSR